MTNIDKVLKSFDEKCEQLTRATLDIPLLSCKLIIIYFLQSVLESQKAEWIKKIEELREEEIYPDDGRTTSHNDTLDNVIKLIQES